MSNQVLEVKWVRGDLSPEESQRRLRAAFRLILDARSCQGIRFSAQPDEERKLAERQVQHRSIVAHWV